MKKLITILSVLFCWIAASSQTKYPLPYDTVIVMKPNGSGYLKASKGIFNDTLFLNNKLKFTTGTNNYVLTSDANGNISLQPGGGGGGTPSLPNRSVQINGNGSFHGTDSLLYNTNGLLNSGNTILGTANLTSSARLVITNDNASGQPYINSGPANSTFSSGYWNYFNSYDSAVTAANIGTIKAVGTANGRVTEMAQNGLTLSFVFGQYNQWKIKVRDSVRWNSANNDGFSAVVSNLDIQKADGFTGRSVILAGGSQFEGSVAQLSNISLNGGSTGNHFYVRGTLVSDMAYMISDNPNHTDTVENYAGFMSWGAGILGPWVKKKFDFVGGALGGLGGNIDSSFGVYIYKSPNVITRNYFGGPVSVDPTGLHNAAVEALEVYGSPKFVDGNQSSGYIWTSDADGKGSWQPASGGGAFWALTGTSTVTDPVIDAAGSNIDFSNVNQLSVRTPTYTSGLLFFSDNGTFSIGDFDGSVNSTSINGNDVTQIIDVTANVFRGRANDSTNYTGRSYVQRDWVLDHIANAGGGTVTSVSGTSNRITSTGGTTPVIDISASYVGQSSITTLGTIGTGTWQGSVINSTYGGMGVNNGGRTLTVNTNNGTLSFTSAVTLTVANTASVSGTNTGDQTITLTGDVTGSGTGSFATTLATVASAGTTGSSTAIPVITINAKGLTTSITTAAVIAPAGTLSGTTLNATVVNSSLTSIGTITSGGLGTGAVIGGVTMTLGSDAANDIYYRNGSGILTRLANGTTGQFLAATTGSAPSWGTPAGGGGITIGTTTITSGTTTRILYDNAGVVGEYTLTGTGTVVAMQTSPSFTTPALGVATATSINKVTITAPATSATLTVVDGGSLITAGAFALTLTSTATSNATIPAGTNTLYSTLSASITSAQLLASMSDETGTGLSVFNSTPTIITPSFTTGFTIGGAAASGKFIVGNGTNYIASTSTIPTSAGATANKVVLSDGTNYVLSTPTFPNASATTRKVIVSDGTNWVASTETYAVPGTSGNLLTSDGTNWTSAAPVVTASSTNTFTNKRWTARVGTTTSSATPTINTDNTDIYKLTAQAAAITSMTSSLSGTPVDGDVLEVQITDNGTARAITWGASFVSSTVSLPTTTVISTTLTVILQYYTTSSYGNNKWVCVNFY